MSGQREIEGLPWPEGDPGGLRDMAGRALQLASELEGRQDFLTGVNPIGWVGVGRDTFAVDLAEKTHTLSAGARAMHEAAAALSALAEGVESAQQTVVDAAHKLKDARDTSARAQAAAQQARADANASDPFGPFGVPNALGPSPAEHAARQAEDTAAGAQVNALQIERWAQGRANHAVDDVTRADTTCASKLDGLGLVQQPHSPQLVCLAPPPATPLGTLGRLLLGSGADTDATLKDLLSQPPPPPPPPPPKPAEKHHSWWKGAAAIGLGVVTTGLVVVDAVQFGADPLTDGATVAVGAETESLAAEAIVGETVAGSAAAAEGTEAAVAVAAEGDPAAGLLVEEGAADAAVEDASVPVTRPSWRDSETDVSSSYKEEGYQEQVSFKDGEEVPYGTKGSSRPELYKPGDSVEVKNYDVTSSQGRSNLVRNVAKQAQQRVANLPQGTTQSLTVDVRGQAVTPETLDELASRIASRSGGAIDMDNIIFLR
jgi:hypothetical protein